MDEPMRMVVSTVQQHCWIANVAGLLVIVLTRLVLHTRHAWGVTGLVLMGIASANAMAVSHAGLNPSQTAASIFSLVILGSLGSRFAGNWLCEGAR